MPTWRGEYTHTHQTHTGIYNIVLLHATPSPALRAQIGLNIAVAKVVSFARISLSQLYTHICVVLHFSHCSHLLFSFFLFLLPHTCDTQFRVQWPRVCQARQRWRNCYPILTIQYTTLTRAWRTAWNKKHTTHYIQPGTIQYIAIYNQYTTEIRLIKQKWDHQFW